MCIYIIYISTHTNKILCDHLSLQAGGPASQAKTCNQNMQGDAEFCGWGLLGFGIVHEVDTSAAAAETTSATLARPVQPEQLFRPARSSAVLHQKS